MKMRMTMVTSCLSLALAACGPQAGPASAQPAPEGSADLAAVSNDRCLCGQAAVVAVNASDGTLYRWTRPTPTSGSFSSSTRVGVGWSSIRLLASDATTGDLFAVDAGGNLRRYPWGGSAYTGGAVIRSGFSGVTQLVAGGYGVLYAIDGNGDLTWYRWLGSSWAAGSGARIGIGWNGYARVFGGGDGVLYGIKSNGDLYWYRHVAPQNGYASWRGPRKVGQGWGSMRAVVGLGGGVIYAVDAQGRLLLYKHLDLVEGGAVWANGGTAQQIGSGWLGYDRLTASPNACPTFPQQCMSQGEALTCGIGGDPNTLYRTFQGVVSPVRYCANGCRSMPTRQTHVVVSGNELSFAVVQDECAAASGQKHVAIQAGHENTAGNCRDALVSATGATDEPAWTADVARRVVSKLAAAGVDARLVDANFNCDPLATQHFDAVVAVHYQPASAAGVRRGYFVGTVDPAFDAVPNASAALASSLDFYFGQAGFFENLAPSLDTIRQYYLKNDDLVLYRSLPGFVLAQDTPFALIECGEGAPGGADHDVLWTQQDLVASSIAEGVLAHLNR